MSLRFPTCLIPAILLASSLSSARAGSSNSLLDVTPDGKHLLVANADNGSVTVIDATTNKALREIAVGDKPEGVAWIGNGPLAAVTVYRDDIVAFVDTAKGEVVEKLHVPDEPYGIVVTKDGTRAYVTHEYPGTVSEIDVGQRKVLREMKAGERVRGLALSPDEKRLYVTEFYTGVLHALDREKGVVVDSWKGQSSDNLCRNVVIHPRRPKAYLSHIRSKIEVIDGSGSIFPQLSVCDLVPPLTPNPSPPGGRGEQENSPLPPLGGRGVGGEGEAAHLVRHG
jgi:YVTN family beta-propeller protein